MAHISEAPFEAAPGAREGHKLGHYALGRRIGRGGMGEVYEATDVRLGRKVALKLLLAPFASNEERRRRFLREARAASSVSHPNITVVYDVGEDDGTVYIAMELLEGRTLRDVLRAEGPLGAAEGVRVVRDIARGLSRAHDAGVVHRDLKPENVMVDGEGLVKILDFGLAKVIYPIGRPPSGGDSTTEMLTDERCVLGTPNYMSPEQAVGDPLDHRTDIFSLGVMLYEMVSGRRPFAGATTVETIIKIARDEPAPLSEVLPNVPDGLERLTARCLAKRPDDRFASCGELLAAIDALEIAPSPAPRGPSGPSPAPQRPSEPSPASPALRAPSEPSLPPRRARPLLPQARASFAVASAVALGALAVAAVRLGRAPQERPSPAAAAAPAAPDLLACPPFSVVPASEGPWLGAAVAQAVCDRVTLYLGGRFERTLSPADLLDLPRLPTSSFPSDPFARPDARDRALSAARARAARWLDGEVEASASGYRVRLSIASAAGVVVERDGRAAEVVRAARLASAALAESGALGAQAEADPAVADWLGAPRVSELLAWHGFEEDESGGLLTPEGTCREVDRLANEAGPLGPLMRVDCALVAKGRPAFEPLPVDASTPGRLSRTARYHHVSGGKADPKALAADLGRAFASAPVPLGRAVLAAAEAEMWLFGGEAEKARERGLVAVQNEPRTAMSWRALIDASVGEPGFGAIVRAAAAWHPNLPWRWRWLAEHPDPSDPASTPASRLLKFARRAHQLVPHDARRTYTLGEQLLRTGEREEVRALAVDLLAGAPEERAAGELLMVLVDASLARFSAAYERGRRALEAGDALGGDGIGDELFRRTMELATLLDRKAELAEALLRHFFEPRPRFGRVASSPEVAISICAAARRPLSGRCFEQVDRLIADNHFLILLPSTLAALEAGKLFARGSYAKAAAAFRPIASEESAATDLLREPMAEAFDRAGDFTMAEIVDRRAMADAEIFHGATMAHARAARRAARRGDKEAARALAGKAAGAWVVADVQPAALPEMRALAGGP